MTTSKQTKSIKHLKTKNK